VAPLAIDQHQHLIALKASEARRFDRLARLTDPSTGIIERWHQLLQVVANIQLAGFLKLGVAQNLDRDGAFLDLPAGARAGHDDFVIMIPRLVGGGRGERLIVGPRRGCGDRVRRQK
jgi:hypothetical protein